MVVNGEEREGRRARVREIKRASERASALLRCVPPADGRIAGAKPTLKMCRRQGGRKGEGKWSIDPISEFNFERVKS